MKTIYHNNESRGHANHGWLDSYHTFSFGHYFDKDRMNFGTLRVLNDDHVAPGEGFPTHPHKNMEIISIPLSGDLEHKDSMGNKTVIHEGDLQVMSAGTGVQHSEYNKNDDQSVHFLQIWIYPNQKNVSPRYDQISIKDLKQENKLFQILSPNKDDQGVWIHQDAWFYLGEYTQETQEIYKLKYKENGVYLFILEGEVKIANQLISRRDGLGIWEIDRIEMLSSPGTKALVMEVPMEKKIIV